MDINFKITVPDNKYQDLVDSICLSNNYAGVNTNPAKLAFIKSRIINSFKSDYIYYKNKQATDALSVDTSLDIT